MKKPTGKLTPYLQREFGRLCPKGWSCRHEEHVLSKQFEQTLGYAARADVLLQSEDSPCRYWIEFEVRRADPVANHAKFATAHLFTPQVPVDVFVSMVSPHVARGRRNLAANAISLMRCVGMNAFQTVLFPHKTRDEIKLLNAMPNADLDTQNLPIRDEIERVFAITQSFASIGIRRIHLVGDLIEVLLKKQLAMQLWQLTDVPGLQPAFADWTTKNRNHITVHPSGPKFLLPPEWF